MRAFIAIDLDAVTKSRLSAVQAQLVERGMRIKWVHPDQMHLTLKFFGDMADSACDAIRPLLDKITASTTPFELTLGGLGIFPPAGRVNVVWVAVSTPPGLLSLHEACEEALAPLRFPPDDRAFAPHLTLGRNKDHSASKGIRAILAAGGPIEIGSTKVGCITFYESVLEQTGPSYRVISRHNLAK
ncbi:MAG: RNA 2',3'-cyclic phosphodiesterase [Planctomycetota bacterium]